MTKLEQARLGIAVPEIAAVAARERTSAGSPPPAPARRARRPADEPLPQGARPAGDRAVRHRPGTAHEGQREHRHVAGLPRSEARTRETERGGRGRRGRGDGPFHRRRHPLDTPADPRGLARAGRHRADLRRRGPRAAAGPKRPRDDRGGHPPRRARSRRAGRGLHHRALRRDARRSSARSNNRRACAAS